MGPSYLHWETSIAPIDLGVETDRGLPRANIPMDRMAIALLIGTIEGADVRSIVVRQLADACARDPLFYSTGRPNQTVVARLTTSAPPIDAVYWSLIMDVRPYLFVMSKLQPLLGAFLPAAHPQKTCSLTAATNPVLETMINLTRALLYCVGDRRRCQHVDPKIEGDWQCRWIPIRNVLLATGIPAYLVAASHAHHARSRDDDPFDFAACVYSEEELSDILSEPSSTNTTSVLIAGCYAETLITDVALSTLKQGYDTFVIWDRVWAISEKGLEAAKARLLQAGAVPTSVDQVLHRWG